MKLTKKISFAAILSALSFLILLVGCVIDTVTLTAAAIASLCIVVAVIELGYTYSLLVYFSVSILAFLLLPVKDPLLYFAGFFGYYPIVKNLAEKANKVLSYVIKGVAFSVAFVAIYFVGIKFFAPEVTIKPTIVFVAYLVLLIVFYLFDYALNKLTVSYINRLRKRMRIDDLLK